jgi:hypothetical protein
LPIPAYQPTPLLLAVVCIPALSPLCLFKSDTHFKFIGLPVLPALYTHLPSAFDTISSL